MPIAAIAPLIGAAIDAGVGIWQSGKERKRQKEFAQHGLQWRVEDARRAGIHPLAALGFQGVSPSPVTVGTDFASVGQNISRSIDATRTNRDRAGAVSKTVQDLQIKRMGLENELLASQIAQINQAGHPPGFPGGNYDIAGQPYTEALALGGSKLSTNRAMSDAQTFEDRYGDSEVAQMAIGAGIVGADSLAALRRNRMRLHALGSRARNYAKRIWRREMERKGTPRQAFKDWWAGK